MKKFYQHAKLEYPIPGAFRVLKKKGAAFKMEHIHTKETFIVHPDYIIQNNQTIEINSTGENNHDTNNTNQFSKSDIDIPNNANVKNNRYNLRNKSGGKV